MKNSKKSVAEISDTLMETICGRLRANKQVRRTLPGRGRLHVDRQLPFLCVYRRPARRDDRGTDQLVKGEAAYLIAPGAKRHREELGRLVREVAGAMASEFGAFLLVEIWAGPDGVEASDPAVPAVPPEFNIAAPATADLTQTIETLERGLREIKVLKQAVAVKIDWGGRCHPPGLSPLLDSDQAAALNCSTIGITVPPVYRDLAADREFPLLLRKFRRGLGHALRPAIQQFVRHHTTTRPPHYHELGRRAVVKAVWEVDRQLSEVSNAFDFLLQLTPINSNEAWHEFKRQGFARAPEFHYRPIPYDPAQLKQRLYQIPIHRVEDPALQEIFQEQQDELDRQITMLRDRDTPRFLYGSLQMYGPVEAELHSLAIGLLKRPAARSRGEAARGQLNAQAFEKRAQEEFKYYRAMYPDFSARTRITRRVAGIMVSRGQLLINPRVKISKNRVDGLLHHEVGTHLLTHFNGRAQPFRQLHTGLAGYPELQEGLAVLAEYLAGGLDRPRMRQLAARVVAGKLLSDGAGFVETFRALNEQHGFAQRTAYSITMRLYRGGGLLKDAIYLRGLRKVLSYLDKGGKIDLLFMGRFSFEHIPVIEELKLRQVLQPAPLRPRYMEEPGPVERLARICAGKVSVLDIMDAPAHSPNDSGKD